MSHQQNSRATPPAIMGLTRNGVSDASALFPPANVGVAYAMHEAPPTSLPAGLSVKKAKPSKIKTGKPLSKLISTPPLRQSVMSDSDLDRKRNKLGYQRISIACAHCRRRKIRCLVAEGDTQQRCQNCIRLKKECVFYPVDQQSALESRSQTSVRPIAGSAASSTVSSSSPDIGSGRSFDDRHEHGGYPIAPSSASGSYQGLPLGHSTTVPNQGNLAHAEYGYQEQGETRSPWPPPGDFGAHPVTMGPPSTVHPNHPYFAYGGMNPTGDFAPFPPVEHMQQHPNHPHVQAYVYPQHSPGQAWQHHQQPMRSMSYGHVETMMPNNQPPYPEGYPGHVQQQPTSMGPPLDMHNASMMEHRAGPHSAPLMEHPRSFAEPVHPYHYQDQRGNATTTSMAPQSAYHGQWYSGTPSFGHEEEHKPG